MRHDDENLLTSAEAARILGLSPSTIRRLAHRGDLGAIRGGTGRTSPFLVPRDAVARIVSERLAFYRDAADQLGISA